MKKTAKSLKAEYVYIVYHEYQLDGCDAFKMIGVLNSEDEALLSIRQLAHQPGFKLHPIGFFVKKYPIGKIFWREGFVPCDRAC